MTLADARARVPDLVVAEHDPEADAGLLDRLAEDCDRWTPLVACDAPDGLILDITGCTHLFGGEATMRDRVRARLERSGMITRAVIAGTPDAARALARFGRAEVVAPGGEAWAVTDLPVAALDCPEETITALRRAGLKTVGDLACRPTTPLAARFGESLTVRLRRVLGHEDARMTPRRTLPDCIVERRFAEPIARTEDIEEALARLVDSAAARLEQRGAGGRRFEAAFFRVDGAVRRIGVETGRPSRDGPAVMRLFRERLDALDDPLDPGFGYDLIRLAVTITEPRAMVQTSLDGREMAEDKVTDLVDRLAARFGSDNVMRFAARDTHDPRWADRLVSGLAARPAADIWPDPEPEAPPLRPLSLFTPPQPIETLAEVPDGPPLRFRWRRVLHEIVRAEGPERIAPEWWNTGEAPTRDYYRVEDAEGRRFWVFRAGLYEEVGTPRWFLHGLFP